MTTTDFLLLLGIYSAGDEFVPLLLLRIYLAGCIGTWYLVRKWDREFMHGYDDSFVVGSAIVVAVAVLWPMTLPMTAARRWLIRSGR